MRPDENESRNRTDAYGQGSAGLKKLIFKKRTHADGTRTYGGSLMTGIGACLPKSWTKKIHAPMVIVTVAAVSKKLRAWLNLHRNCRRAGNSPNDRDLGGFRSK